MKKGFITSGPGSELNGPLVALDRHNKSQTH